MNILINHHLPNYIIVLQDCFVILHRKFLFLLLCRANKIACLEECMKKSHTALDNYIKGDV